MKRISETYINSSKTRLQIYTSRNIYFSGIPEIWSATFSKYGALRRSGWFIRAEARSRVAGFLSRLFLQSSWYIFRLGDKWEIIMTSIYRLYARESGRGKSNVGRTSLCKNRCREIQKGYRAIATIWHSRKFSIECGSFGAESIPHLWQ